MKLRKTITFREDIYNAIQKERAQIMIGEGEDFTFTEAVNYMLEELLELRVHEKDSVACP